MEELWSKFKPGFSEETYSRFMIYHTQYELISCILEGMTKSEREGPMYKELLKKKADIYEEVDKLFKTE